MFVLSNSNDLDFFKPKPVIIWKDHFNSFYQKTDRGLNFYNEKNDLGIMV